MLRLFSMLTLRAESLLSRRVVVRRYQPRRRFLATAFLGIAIFATTFVSVSQHQLHDEMIVMGSAQEVRVPHRQLRSPDRQLKILSFGDAVYAEMLSDTIVSDSYMDLVVACTQSMVGDAFEYDAVTIPLGPGSKWLDHSRVLLDRIRKRFPKAVIVLVEIELLAGLTLYPTVETYQQWHVKRIQEEGRNVDSSTVSFLASDTERAQAMIDDAAKVQGNWIWGYSSGAEDKRLLERRRVDPLLVTYRLDPTFRSVTEANDFLNLFAPDGGSLSQSGQVKIANDIRSLIQSTMERTVLVRRDRESMAQLKSWGTGDDCHLWFASGDYLPSTAQPLDLPQPYSNHWHKHALEFRKHHNDSISINNPFPTERMLFLTYLTDADSMDYSTTRVFVNGAPTVEIHPFHDNNEHGIHIARTAAVGLVPPGASTIVLEPLTTGLPFWLVGSSILAQEALELPIVEFDLVREHLVDMQSDKRSVTFR